MSATYDVILVGLGAMGTSAALHLARRGVRVLGLEQFDVPHAFGSSHGQSRMIRMAYYEHPHYVPLLRRAYDLWHELEHLCGQTLLHQTGGLYLGRPDSELIAGSLRSAREHALPHDLLDHAALRTSFPQFRVPDGYVGLFEKPAGFLLPERAVSAAAELALRHGADLRAREAVAAWSSSGVSVTVTTSRGTYSAAHLVFCAGAWTARLLRDIDVSLLVTRQVLGWVWPRVPGPFALGRFPVFAIGHDDGSLHYGFPLLPTGSDPGPLGLKVAHHTPGLPADPDSVERLVLPGDEATFRPALGTYLPDAAGTTLATRVCLYTNSPDHHFILGPHPTRPNVTLAAGFSGHGFKFATVVGEALADLATRGRTDLPVDFLSPARFAGT